MRSSSLVPGRVPLTLAGVPATAALDPPPHDLVNGTSWCQVRIAVAHAVILFTKQCDVREGLDMDQSRAQAVIDVMTVVGNLVGEVGQLCLQRGLQLLDKTTTEFTQCTGIFQRAVLEDTFATFKGQVQIT